MIRSLITRSVRKETYSRKQKGPVEARVLLRKFEQEEMSLSSLRKLALCCKAPRGIMNNASLFPKCVQTLPLLKDIYQAIGRASSRDGDTRYTNSGENTVTGQY